jgi:23S rRNA pseudouridine2605 synthase
VSERLQKIIAKAGVCSRRAAEELIATGRVRVNGRVVTELGAKADPQRDRIDVDNRRIQLEDFWYVVLHKPRGYVSTLDDPEGRPTVADLVKDVPVRVHPVGRLDFATSGVLLMTNDGELTNKLTHPRTKAPKKYVVKLDREVSDQDLERWRKGVELEDGPTLPADVYLLRHEAGKAWIAVTLYEGRNQQIRRMAAATGMLAMRLARVEFAGITAADLRPGQWRALTVEELRDLKKRFGAPKRIRRPDPDAPTQSRAPRRTKGPGKGPARKEAERRAQPKRAGEARDESRPAASQRGGSPVRNTRPAPRQPPTAGRSARSGTKPRAAGPPASRGRARGRR